MGWLSRIGAFFKATMATIALFPRVSTEFVSRITGDFLTLVSEGYRLNALVYACVRLKATSLPEAPLKVVQHTRTSTRELRTHPMQRLIDCPNPLMTQFEMIELIVTHLDICGKSYWWKERNRLGQPIALWPLRPDRVKSVRGGEVLVAYEYRIDGETFILPRQDVIAFNYPDPGSDDGGIVGGLGALQVAARDVDTDNEAGGFVFNVLRNFAIPGVVVKTKASLTEPEATRLKKRFMEKYGQAKRGEPIVLDSDAEIQPLSYSLDQLAFPDIRAIGEARICAVFGVPPILVGAKVGLDRSTFANMAEAREFFAETTLAVLWRRLGDQFTSDLVPDFDESGNIVAEFDTSKVKALQRQIQERSLRYKEGFQAGVVTVNEYRVEVLSLPALETEIGDVFVRTAMSIEVPVTMELREQLEEVSEVPALPAGTQPDVDEEEA